MHQPHEAGEALLLLGPEIYDDHVRQLFKIYLVSVDSVARVLAREYGGRVLLTEGAHFLTIKRKAE